MTAINLQMFGTPKAVYQRLNINQLTPSWGNIAYQEDDSLLAGKGVSLIYSLNNTVTLTYGITGNQSDKISSGYLANVSAQHSAKLFAQPPAKTLADVSAKIYANQSPKFTGNQSAKHFANLKRGEFTPLAKGDFSHLMQGLFGITTRGKIEFLESIKKGSQSATLGNVDIKYRASENINTSLLLWHGKYQPFGLMPSRSNSLRPRVLSQLPRLIPDSDAADSNCSFNSGVILIWNVGDNPFPFSVLSLFSVDMYVRNPLVCCLLCTYSIMKYVLNKTPPSDITSINRGLTTNDSLIIEVAMHDHNTPVTGRTSLTPNQSYRWLKARRAYHSIATVNILLRARIFTAYQVAT